MLCAYQVQQALGGARQQPVPGGGGSGSGSGGGAAPEAVPWVLWALAGDGTLTAAIAAAGIAAVSMRRCAAPCAAPMRHAAPHPAPWV